MSDLFDAIERHLRDSREQARARRRFTAAMDTADAHLELWAAIRPFIRTADDYRNAARFIGAWLRDRTR